MVRCGTVGPFDYRPNRLAPKAGDLGFRHPAAGSLSPPVCRVVGVNRTLGGGHRAHRRSDVLPRRTAGCGGALKPVDPLAVLVAVVVGQPGVEVALCRRTGGHCAQADTRPNPRTYEGIFRPRVWTLNCNRQKGQFCPGRRAPSCRRSVPRRQSPSARHEPGCGRRRSNERPPGRAAGHRGCCLRFCQAVPVADRISLSKHQRPRNPETRIFPLGLRAVLGRAASSGKRRL